MNPQVTIIIPVYNVSAYIEKCAHSLFSQTMHEVEFIFVNDASTDNSILKLEKTIALYPEIINKVQIIQNEQNQGPAISRNKALDYAKGEYILVVDSDDFIDSDMVETMYYEALISNADIVACDMLIEYAHKSIYFSDYVPENSSEFFPNMLTNIKSTPSLCNKLIKRSLYLQEQCRSTTNAKYIEDKFVSACLYYYATKITKVNRPFYHYIKHNPDSTTYSFNQTHFESLVLFWQKMDEFLLKNNLTEKYAQLTSITKVRDKVNLLFKTDSYKIRKQFSAIFSTEEAENFKHLKFGEKLMVFLVRKKLFIFTSLLRNLIQLKTKYSSN